MSNDERVIWKWISGILGGVISVLLAAWLVWVSTGTVANTKDIAVNAVVVENVKGTLCEIQKTLIEIRQDQLRREKREK